MTLSHADLSLLVEELATRAIPGVIQKVFPAGARRLTLQVRVPGHTHHIFLSAAPGDARAHLVEERPRVEGRPDAFVMQLRKWLHGAWIEAIDLDPADRVLTFQLSAVDPDWEPQPEDDKAPRRALRLIAELVGHHPNIVLVEDDQVLGLAHARTLGDRQLRPSTPYLPPPPPPELGPPPTPELQNLPADGSRSAYIDRHTRATLAQEARESLFSTLSRDLRSRAKSLRRRVKHIEEDLQRIDEAADFKKFGELLQSAYGRVERGASEVRVPDYYVEGMPEITITLDPAHDLQWNIDRYFHQYRRYKEARDDVETRYLESADTLEALTEARQRLQELAGADFDTLIGFKQELRNQGLLKTTHRQRAARKALAPRPPYREFRSRRDDVILVGRGARHNDALTTRIARGRDLWLHARDWAGAHVVVRRDRGEDTDSETLLDAATLAAYFSRGREDSLIDVTYTDARHVRKPRGAAPGLVTIAAGSTIAVTIDEERLKRLLASEVDEDAD
ncbi:fibronectin-binding domain-containing protein [Lujinxingia vulgaris]|uniref:Fibronectin-binding domain-containing protein n=1 Tax=Lujinxingia vulgaris TaxID=2600176 RepID=A0A5C6XGD4_9DELT|nr:NFACT family protein [Lujinxingia vulgaris]TXD38924.1 fibronectin-binding domain-containing protein [Lujinxingia vulgaris]